MNNEIRIIKREQEQPNQPNQSKLQNIKKEVITQNSPILKQIRETEEKHKLRQGLSIDELIDLDFKEIADKIRAEKKIKENQNNINNQESDTLDKATFNSLNSLDTAKEMPIKELPIDDKNLAYIRDLEEPVLPDFNNSQIKIKVIEGIPTRQYETLHREPLRREALNKFGVNDNTKQGIDSSKIDSNEMKPDVNEPMGLIDRLRMDRERMLESKKDEIRKVEIAQPPKNNELTNNNKNAESSDNKVTNEAIDDNHDFINDVILPTFNVDTFSSNEDIENKNISESRNSLEYEVDELNYIANNLSVESIIGTDYYPKTQEDGARSITSTAYADEVAESQDLSPTLESLDYKLPHIGLLDEPKYQKIDIDGSEIDLKAHNLISKLRVFRINGDVTDIYSGPVVTTFEFRPAPDVKVSRIQNLENDLSMTLKAKSIRIQAPIPGKDVVGIEIPNNTIQTIYIREIFESPEFVNSDAQLAIALGKDIIGKPVVQDLAKLPHLLIAGTTGSGKSVGLNGMILSLLYRNTPEQLRFIMIDPKRVELSLYKDIPHLLTPIIADPKKAVIALSKAVDEMNRRYELMNEVGVKNIIGYNEAADQKGFDRLPYIVIIIDEFADLMIMGGKDSEQYLTSLASKARASGIHLIIATQRPTVNVVTGLIKSNLPSRISYRVGSPMDSKVVLDKVGAETLLGNGDMLFSNTNVISRYHAPYSNEKEIERVANFIRSQRSVEYDEYFSLEPKEIIQATPANSAPMSEDEYMQKAKEIILSSGRTSASYLQRMLGIGFNRASNILETLEREGFLSAPNSKNIREIIG